MKTLLSLLLLIFSLVQTAQNAAYDIPWPEKEIWLESPRARAFREVAMPSLGLLTGACEFSVPLYTLEDEDLSLPLQLNYRSNSIRVEDDPCPVGYGWVLSPDLRYVLPPGVSPPEDRSRDDMQKLAFWYDYDSRGRCILRKIPGAREARFRYDPADRLVAEQSVNHPDGEWRVYGYDNCGRLVFACDCLATDAEIDAFAAVCRTASPSGNPHPRGYSLSPPASLDLNTVWARFYDDYAFVDNLCLGEGFRFAAPPDMPVAPRVRPAGLLTGLYTGEAL